MARSQSVFAISRGIWDDPDFADEPFTEREAWAWLIGAAAWADHRTRGAHGRAINLKRGEFSFSVRFLAEKFQWSKSRTQRFLKSVQQRDTIRDTSRDGCQIYFITKYNQFQIVGLPERDVERDSVEPEIGTEAGQQRDKVETGKTGKYTKDANASLDAPSRKRATSLPSDFPGQSEFDYAIEKWSGVGRQDLIDAIAEHAQAFRDYHLARGDPSKDWAASWRTWVRKTPGFQRQFNGERRQSPHDKFLAAGLEAIEARDRARSTNL